MLFVIGVLLFPLSLVVNVLAITLVVRFAKKLLSMDSMFSMIVDDIDVNIEFLDSVLERPLTRNDPDIRNINNNLNIMRQRFAQFALDVREMTHRNDDAVRREETGKLGPPPAAID